LHALTLLAASVLHGQSFPQFREHTIATDLKGGYQVVAVDLNGDGKKDVIALASGMKELVWFENPGWTRHTIADGFSQMINLAVVPAGGGIPDIVLAHEFSMEASKSVGVVSLLQHVGDPKNPWKVTEIDRLPTSHRLRVADIDGNGKPVVVNAPLTGASAAGPDYRGRMPLVFYRPGEWKRRLIGDENEGVMHGIYVIDWDGDGRDEILTASFVGIHLYKLNGGGKWSRTEIAKGSPAPWPKCGASDVAVGQLGKRRFVCSIEPWHGNEVVVYTQRNGGWERQSIDSSLVEGHTIATADLDGDGRDEIVAGYRGKGRSVYIYQSADAEGREWVRHVLDDGGIAANACAVADLNGDGRPDIACIGGATADLKWYENLVKR
jgi:hypothetical protein